MYAQQVIKEMKEMNQNAKDVLGVVMIALKM
jgi:hypothetical protein